MLKYITVLILFSLFVAGLGALVAIFNSSGVNDD